MLQPSRKPVVISVLLIVVVDEIIPLLICTEAVSTYSHISGHLVTEYCYSHWRGRRVFFDAWHYCVRVSKVLACDAKLLFWLRSNAATCQSCRKENLENKNCEINKLSLKKLCASSWQTIIWFFKLNCFICFFLKISPCLPTKIFICLAPSKYI